MEYFVFFKKLLKNNYPIGKNLVTLSHIFLGESHPTLLSSSKSHLWTASDVFCCFVDFSERQTLLIRTLSSCFII
jgi:hypothetical protein